METYVLWKRQFTWRKLLFSLLCVQHFRNYFCFPHWKFVYHHHTNQIICIYYIHLQPSNLQSWIATQPSKLQKLSWYLQLSNLQILYWCVQPSNLQTLYWLAHSKVFVAITYNNFSLLLQNFVTFKWLKSPTLVLDIHTYLFNLWCIIFYFLLLIFTKSSHKLPFSLLKF